MLYCKVTKFAHLDFFTFSVLTYFGLFLFFETGSYYFALSSLKLM